MNFNSHTPHGVRLSPALKGFTYIRISTHTPHTGCDKKKMTCVYFLQISTHTPHTGCDEDHIRYDIWIENFNSHTPHGVRL